MGAFGGAGARHSAPRLHEPSAFDADRLVEKLEAQLQKELAVFEEAEDFYAAYLIRGQLGRLQEIRVSREETNRRANALGHNLIFASGDTGL